MDDKRGIGIVAIATFVIAIVMLATIQSAAAAYAVDTAGQIEYEGGTPCPAGWTVCEDNLNRTYSPDTWCESTFGDGGYIIFDYLVTGQADSDDDYIWVNVTSPDGKWYGEKIVKLSDAWDPVWSHYVVDIVVYEQELPEFSKELPAGWNLISLPLKPSVNSTSTVLSGVSQDAVYSYNAALNSFEDVSSGTMDSGIGYFVHVTSPSTWTYNGSAYLSMNAGLSQGLNMVGWLNCTKAISETSLSNPSNVYYIARWNATAQSYETHNPAAPDPYTPGGFNDNFFDMERGTGYFISAREGYTTLSESC